MSTQQEAMTLQQIENRKGEIREDEFLIGHLGGSLQNLADREAMARVSCST